MPTRRRFCHPARARSRYAGSLPANVARTSFDQAA
jgi:hypothetical protein